MFIDIKHSLRITNTAFDTEVKDLIDAARLDLIQAGISSTMANAEGTDVDPIDPLIKRAITVYCKANFGYDNPDADRFHDSYVMLKQHLSLAGDYRETQ